MLTRLKVTGFKNLVDVDVRFGPFTCIAGMNGVGKSNLFDAILFMSALADDTFIEAAFSINKKGGRGAEIRNLFHRVGSQYDEEMSFEAEMIVPSRGVDDLGQEAKASISFLRYSVTLAYNSDDSELSSGSIELKKEELNCVNVNKVREHLQFDYSSKWKNSALQGQGKLPFISTEGGSIKLHRDGERETTRVLNATRLPRTVLSTVNTSETPTVLLARREMQSWKLLHLEPSSLRNPDKFSHSSSPVKLGADGSHLAATIYRLAKTNKTNGLPDSDSASQVYSQISNRLAELIEDVREIDVDHDQKRELLTLQVTGWDGTIHPAQALSDGTLRFLALAALELDPEAQGLLCLEEPENGLAPDRIPAMLRLLQDIAMDVNFPIGEDNPLRQVIINTHSPAVVSQVPDDSLLIAELEERVVSGKRFKAVTFSYLPNTWRVRKNDKSISIVSKGKLLAYLNPALPPDTENETNGQSHKYSGKKQAQLKTTRVIDRPDLRSLSPYFSIQDED